MPTFFVAPTTNFFSTTLNGSVNSTQTTGITLNSVTNLQAPGKIIIDREDSNGTATPNAREIIEFTGISGNELTGVTRPADGSTARAHNDAALVESVPTVGLWNSLTTIVATSMTSDGYLKAIASPVSISAMHINTLSATSIASTPRAEMANLNVSSTASIAVGFFGTRLDASGASLTGFPVVPVFAFTGTLSGASTLLQTPLPMPRAGEWRYANFVTRTVASGVSAIVDINKNGTSIFAAVGRPMIVAGGTFASTASIATKGFDAGDRISWDYDGTGGTITDFNVLLVSD